MTRVAILTGGSTPERHVALAGARQVVTELRDRGHVVTAVDTVTGPMGGSDEARLLDQSVGRSPPTLEETHALAKQEHLEDIVRLPELSEVDIVFLVLHGRQGEGGEIQSLLDEVNIEYTGSGADASALAMDKCAAKVRIAEAGIPIPPGCTWPASSEELAALEFPLIVKPSKVGSSVGLSLIQYREDLDAAVENSAAYDDDVILERYLDGREFTVGVLRQSALAVGEIIPSHVLFDYECKYTKGMTEDVFPADIPKDLEKQLQTWALAAHQALGLRDFSRIDFKLDAGGAPHFLEANTLPGLTDMSLLPQSAAAVGISFGDLIEAICGEATSRRAGGGTKYTPEAVD